MSTAPHHRIIIGDVLDGLRSLPDGLARCCVTSPPYWGLRDYGTGKWEGGDAACDHEAHSRARNAASQPGVGNAGRVLRDGIAGVKTACDCGAVRIDHQIGLEPTPEAYIERMVGVFREVRRVLADDGTLWLNMGDGYAQNEIRNRNGENPEFDRPCRDGVAQTGRRMSHGLKPKDLIGMPWRLAFALQADGWYLRSDIIWAKPNPMPESVTDRPTKSHEYIFLLSKRERYYFDAEAVKEQSVGRELFGNSRSKGHCEQRQDNDRQDMTPTVSRNARTVWTIATQPYSEAHFATYPEALPERCVKAGSSERGKCPECGAAWVRKVETTPNGGWTEKYQSENEQHAICPGGRNAPMSRGRRCSGADNPAARTFLGWEPTCTHGHDPIPDTVLDPFAGSGTTLLVANKLGRNAIGCELNPAYAAMAERRIGTGLKPSTFRDDTLATDAPLFGATA